MSSRSIKSRYALLGMLSIRPMSGYDIKKLIEASISNFWSESYGQIYPTLKQLVAEKLVTRTVKKQTGKPDRHVYALTPAGRRRLREWLARRCRRNLGEYMRETKRGIVQNTAAAAASQCLAGISRCEAWSGSEVSPSRGADHRAIRTVQPVQVPGGRLVQARKRDSLSSA